jgi:hypothetical protein
MWRTNFARSLGQKCIRLFGNNLTRSSRLPRIGLSARCPYIDHQHFSVIDEGGLFEGSTMLAIAQWVEFHNDAIAGLERMFIPAQTGKRAGTRGQLAKE